MNMAYVILLMTIALLAGCGRGAEKAAPAAPEAGSTVKESDEPHASPNEVHIDDEMLRDLRVTTAAVESRIGGEEVVLLGQLEVDQRSYAEVGVPVVARAIQVLAGPGDTVRAGQMLLEAQSGELGRVRSDYDTAQARLTLAERTLTRKRDLAAERIAPEREVQEAEADVAQARASLRSAAAALTSLGVAVPTDADGATRNSSIFGVRSPIRGTVIERNVVRGQMLDPSTPAFKVADLSRLWLTVNAFERDAVRIAKGATARLSFPALPGEPFRGTVALVGHQVDQVSRTVPVRIEVRSRGDALRPGMSASARVPVGVSNQPMLTVPVAAVQRVGDNWCVFLPKDGSTFEIRKIGRGRDLGTEVEVVTGLRAGEKIVVDGAFLLKSQAEKSDADHDEH